MIFNLAITFFAVAGTSTPEKFDFGMNIAIIVIPISSSFLLAVYNSYQPDNKYMLLRVAAESVKREIFKYADFIFSFFCFLFYSLTLNIFFSIFF